MYSQKYTLTPFLSLSAVFLLQFHILFAKEKSKAPPLVNAPSKVITKPTPDKIHIAGIQALKHFLPEISENRERLGFKPSDDLEELTIGTAIPVLLLTLDNTQTNFEALFTPTNDYWFPVHLRGTPKAIVTITQDETAYTHQSFGFSDFATGIDPILDTYQATNPISIVLCQNPITACIKIDGLKYNCLMPIPTTTQTGMQLAKKPTPTDALLRTLTPINPDLQPFP